MSQLEDLIKERNTLASECAEWRHEAKRQESRAEDFHGNCINLNGLLSAAQAQHKADQQALAASQARVKELKPFLEHRSTCYVNNDLQGPRSCTCGLDALSTPSDTSALDAAIRAAVAEATAKAREEEREKLPGGVRAILAERLRQTTTEGWTPEHDDEHALGELAGAAACYARASVPGIPDGVSLQWPWGEGWWKPSTRRRNLEKAGALIAAEIDRLDRAGLREGENP